MPVSLGHLAFGVLWERSAHPCLEAVALCMGLLSTGQSREALGGLVKYLWGRDTVMP